MTTKSSPNSSKLDKDVEKLAEETSSLDDFPSQDQFNGLKTAESQNLDDMVKSYDIKAREIMKRLRELRTDSNFSATCNSCEGKDVFEDILRDTRRVIEELRQWRKTSGLDELKVLPVVDELQEIIDSFSVMRKKSHAV